jgi:hypothetical protein
MKCERCGCEIDSLNADGKWNFERDTYSHDDKNKCIATLKAKLAEKFTSEPMKPDRFATLRLFTRQHHPVYNDVIPELNDLFAAFDEVNQLIDMFLMDPTAYINGYPIHVSYFPEKIKTWRDKWK